MGTQNGSVSSNGFTRIESILLRILADGERHTRDELHRALPDELSNVKVLRTHISNIRPKLPDTQEIICELWGGRIHYRHIRILTPKDSPVAPLTHKPNP